MSTDERMTVSALARLSGISVRTLHHYDAIGLLEPSGRSAAGYRWYSPEDVARLAQVLAYRAGGLALSDIHAVLAAAGTERAEHLRRQIALLERRAEQLQQQRAVLMRALEAQQMGINLDPEEIFEVFGDADPRQYADEAEARWGETDAYRESHRRTTAYTKEDWLRQKSEAADLLNEFAACLDAGLPADDARAMAAAEAHRQGIDSWFYPCSHEMQVSLAEMYVADPRFAAYYDDVRSGLAQYVHDAILANAIARMA